MNCEQVKTHLVDYLYGELPAELARKVEEALEECPECAAELDQMRAVHHLFDALPRLDVPAPVHHDILRQARLAAAAQSPSQPVAKSFWASVFSPPALATALLLTLVVGVGVMLEQQTRSTDEAAGWAQTEESGPTVVALGGVESAASSPAAERPVVPETDGDGTGGAQPGDFGGIAVARAESPPPADIATNAFEPLVDAEPSATPPDEPNAMDVVAQLEADESPRAAEESRSARRTPRSAPPAELAPEQFAWRGAGDSEGGGEPELEEGLAQDLGATTESRVGDRTAAREDIPPREPRETTPPAERAERAEPADRDRHQRASRPPASGDDEAATLDGATAAEAPPPAEVIELEPMPRGQASQPEEPARERQVQSQSDNRGSEEYADGDGVLEEATGEGEDDDGEGLLRLVETASPEPTQWVGEQSIVIAGNEPTTTETPGAGAGAAATAPPPTVTSVPVATGGAGPAPAPAPDPDAVALAEPTPVAPAAPYWQDEYGAAGEAEEMPQYVAEEEAESEVDGDADATEVGETADLDLDVLYERGVQRYNDGSYRAAISYFSLLIDNAPRTSDFYALSNFYQGQSLMGMGYWSQAVDNFEAIDDPRFEHYEEARLLLAQAYENAGDLEQAEQLYGELLASTNSETNAMADEGLERIERRRRANDANARPSRNRESMDSLDYDPAAPAGADEAPAESAEKPVTTAYKP